MALQKKGNKGKKERIWKQRLLKNCHQGQNVTVLAILECLELKDVFCPPTIVAGNTFQYSMAPPLWNPFCRSCCVVVIDIEDYLLLTRTIRPINFCRAVFNSTLKDFTSLSWDWTLPLSRIVIRLLLSLWLTFFIIKAWK